VSKARRAASAEAAPIAPWIHPQLLSNFATHGGECGSHTGVRTNTRSLTSKDAHASQSLHARHKAAGTDSRCGSGHGERSGTAPTCCNPRLLPPDVRTKIAAVKREYKGDYCERALACMALRRRVSEEPRGLGGGSLPRRPAEHRPSSAPQLPPAAAPALVRGENEYLTLQVRDTRRARSVYVGL